MTALERRPSAPSWRGRARLDLLQDQLAAIDAWNAARRAAEQAVDTELAAVPSREARLDLTRRLDVVRRQHQALVSRTEQQLREGTRASGTATPRAVIVHRNDWFRSKLASALAAGAVEVVAILDNGADAVGVAVAEQPDLLLVEDRLPMVHGDDVLRQVLAYSPGTVAAAQVSSEEGAPVLLEAGARVAFPRRVPPGEVADDLLALLA